jgi:DNA invertase Pin-like site-specific DNA recombinase
VVKLYSYARFSSDKQKEGDSIHRQLGLAEEFVVLHPQYNLELINRYQDEAVSAKKGRNITVGMLGEFLRDVKSSEVEKGSWLGIEDFDRLSRQNYWDAKAVFEEIMNLGITLVTFGNRKTYDLEGLKRTPYDFMNSLMSMVSANEYIERMRRHSTRVWKSKREAAQQSHTIMSANVPHWIDTIVDEISPSGKAIKQHFELNEEKSAIVRQIISLFLNGQGCQTIARQFNLENVPCLGRNRQGKYWQPGNVRAILSNEALCGRYVHKKRDGKALPTSEIVTVEDYYLPLVTTATYNEIALLLKSNHNAKTRPINMPANPLQGLCHCSECGSLMTRVSQRAYRGRKAYEKLVCIGAKTGKHKYRSIAVDEVIGHLNMLLTFPQAFNPNEHDAMTPLQTKRADYELRATRLTNEMAIMGGSAAIRKALAGIEADMAALDQQIAEEASKAVYSNAQRMNERLIEAREAMGGAVIGPSFADRLKGVPVGLPSDRKALGAEAINGLLRRLFKAIKIDIQQNEIWATWLDGRTSVLTVQRLTTLSKHSEKVMPSYGRRS